MLFHMRLKLSFSLIHSRFMCRRFLIAFVYSEISARFEHEKKDAMTNENRTKSTKIDLKWVRSYIFYCETAIVISSETWEFIEFEESTASICEHLRKMFCRIFWCSFRLITFISELFVREAKKSLPPTVKETNIWWTIVKKDKVWRELRSKINFFSDLS